jgi:hypothetical protein
MIEAIPEWVELQGKPINGLDLTGLRLPVDAISTYQLIGITTVTPRVRFLSIRAWIIKAFSESGLPNSYESFADFATRVETAIIFAVLLNKRDMPSLPGVTKALFVIDEGLDPIFLEKLVDQRGYNLYAGSSYNLFLGYANEDNIPGLTQERGVPLAEIFEGLINQTAFFKALKAHPTLNSVARQDLIELGQAINLEEVGEEERTSLLSALLPPEPADKWREREIRRIGAYTLMLELAKCHQRLPKEDDLFDAALTPVTALPKQLFSVLDGYLCYRIRDALAVAHEAMLGLVCRELGGFEGSVHHDRIIYAVAKDPESDLALRKLGLMKDEETVSTVRFLTLVERVGSVLLNQKTERGLVRWQSELDENTLIKTILQNSGASTGVTPVLWLLCRHRVATGDPEAFPHLEMLLQAGSARVGLREVVFPQLETWTNANPLLIDVISWLLQRTVDQHLRIAWSRMFADMNKDVAILLCDGDLWQHRGKNYIGGRMASRISDAIGWLEQLQLLDRSGLTQKGEEVLTRGYEVLTRHGGEA